MAKTASGLIKHMKALVAAKTPYVFGYKGQTVTGTGIKALAKAYKAIFTSSYIAKAMKFIGRKAVDCSGAISSYTGKLRGSASMRAAAVKVVVLKVGTTPPEACKGWVLWKDGHVGVYAGDNVAYEARGINYGCVKTKASTRGFTHALLLPEIEDDIEETPAKSSSKKTTKKVYARVVNVKTNLLMRAKPSLAGKVVNRLKNGTRVRVLSGGTTKYARIMYGDVKGYAARKYLKDE